VTNIAPVKTFSYDPIGNLLSKSDVGTSTYPVAGAALPHAVSSINGAIVSTFTYGNYGDSALNLSPITVTVHLNAYRRRAAGTL
jgi:hypothetical protein